MRTTTPFLLLTVLLSSAAFPAVWYVDIDNTSGTEDGTSWDTAFRTIQAGVDVAYDDLLYKAESSDARHAKAKTPYAEVWVAEGVYGELRVSYPHGREGNAGWSTGSLMMKAAVRMYGGFVGDETDRNQRNFQTHTTTVDGTTARAGSPAYHVVAGADNASLDGFTITGGRATGGTSGDDIRRFGAGIFNDQCSPIINNCTLSDNSASSDGGGMCNWGASPTVTNCTFSGNSARFGGGMHSGYSSSPTITNCTFFDNSAYFYDGGGMCNWGASPTVTNCTFSDNFANRDGGGIRNISCLPVFNNCIFSGNSARCGGGMYSTEHPAMLTNCIFSHNSASIDGGGMGNAAAPAVLTNCILWDNGTEITGSALVQYSDVEGGIEGTGNMASDPLFADAVNGDFPLQAESPCIDAATDDGAPETDIRGIPRPQGEGIDMGAHEYAGVPWVFLGAPSVERTRTGPVSFEVS